MPNAFNNISHARVCCLLRASEGGHTHAQLTEMSRQSSAFHSITHCEWIFSDDEGDIYEFDVSQP